MQGVVIILLVFYSTISLAADKIDAQLHWAQRVELSTLVSGTILSVNAEPGQLVKSGDVMLTLDGRKFKAERDKSSAIVDKATAENDEAKRELDRTQQLYDRSLISDHELDVAKINAQRAQALLKKSQAELVQAQLDVEYSEVRAPFDALVLQKHVEAGQVYLSQLKAEPLLVIAKSGAMLAKGELNGTQAAKMTLGQRLAVQIGGKKFEGVVQSLAPESGAAAGKAAHYSIAVYVETGGRRFAAGTEASIEIP